MSTERCWSLILAQYVDSLNPPVEINEETWSLINTGLTDLEFGASRDAVLAVLTAQGVPGTVFDSIDFESWRKELAEMKLRRLVREGGQPSTFDARHTRAEFHAQITEHAPANEYSTDNTLQDNITFFISLMRGITEKGPDYASCCLAAIANALLNYDLYAFTELHRRLFLSTVNQHVAFTNLVPYLIDGIARMNLSTGVHVAAAVARLKFLQELLHLDQSLKQAFDRAVIAMGPQLLENAAKTTFDDTVAVLQACDGGQEVLNNYVKTYDRVVGLINRGVQFSQFRSAGVDAPAGKALFSNLDTLFNQDITVSNHETISGFVGAGLAVNSEEVNAFRSVLLHNEDDIVHTLLHRGRVGGQFTIDQVSRLYSGREGYRCVNNVAFRKTQIKAVLLSLHRYLDSLNYQHGYWSDGYNRYRVRRIRGQLEFYKKRLESFNSSSAVAYQRAGHDSAVYHGSNALQHFVKSNPVIASKLQRIYGSSSRVSQSFTLCDLPKRLKRNVLAQNFTQRIHRVTTLEDLQAVANDIHQLRSGVWYRSNKSWRAQFAGLVKAQILSTEAEGALLGLLGKLSPQEIVEVCNRLTPRARAVSVQDIQMKVLDCLKGLLDRVAFTETRLLVTQLNQLMAACDRYSDILNKTTIVKELKEHFLAFVAAGLITEENIGAMKIFLGEAVPAETLAAEMQRRQSVFLRETLPIERVSKVVILAELTALAAASQTVEGKDFRETIYGSDGADDSGCLAQLLAKGLLLSEVTTAVSLATMTTAPKFPVLSGQIQYDLLRQIQDIVDDRTNDPKKAFARVARVFNNVDNGRDADSLRTTIKEHVNEYALALCERGVSIRDLTAIDPKLTLAALELNILESTTTVDKVTKLKQLRDNHIKDASGRSFLNSLPQGYRMRVLRVLANNNIPKPLRAVVLDRAFAGVKASCPFGIDDQGKLIDGENISAVLDCHGRVFDQAVRSVLREAADIQRAQGLSPDRLGSARAVRNAVVGLHEAINEFRRNSRGRIQSLCLSLDEIEILRRNALDTPTPDAIKALELANGALANYRDYSVDQLIELSLQDRAGLMVLADQVRQKMIAIDSLMQMDTAGIFVQAVLQDIKTWKGIKPSSIELMKKTLAELKDPILFYQAKAKGFSSLLALGSELTVGDKIAFVGHLTDSIKKAERIVVAKIAQSLADQNVMGSSIVFSGFEDQAAALWHRRLDLARIEQELEQQLSEQIDIRNLHTKLLNSTRPQEPAEGREIIVPARPAALALSEKPTFSNINALFAGDVNSEQPSSASPPDDSAALPEGRYPVRLGDQHFTMVEVRSAGANLPPRIEMDMTEVLKLDRDKRAIKRSDVEAAPVDKEFFKLAFEKGAAWAQMRMDAPLGQQSRAMFWRQEKKCLAISGDFRNSDTHKGQFELAVMYVAIQYLEQNGYGVQDSPVFRQFKAALEENGAELIARLNPLISANPDKVINRANLAEQATHSIAELTRAIGR